MARPDPHSYSDDTQPRIRELTWRARVDFERRVLDGEVLLTLDRPGDGPLDLDTRDLELKEVTDGEQRRLPYRLAKADPVLGACLHLELPRGTKQVRIRYATTPNASALQWLSPEQTAGGKHPFLFSQCQAIHARSVLPIQDTPRIRITFEAELTIPAPLRALMAAAFLSREEKGAEAVEHYRMPQPIPPYLIAFAVGELTSRELGPRSRVWAEPSVVEQAAWEFAGVEDMIGAAEKLFGPYAWDRFDILTMPPSFPYGGMENPRLTFLTPTLLAKDRSLVNVLAHELAHSWTGNLVTNASAEHFWLNEGFTVYAERRILEALEGPDVAGMHAALGRRSLDEAVAQFHKQPELTRLRTTLLGVDPDDAFSQVPYEKGYLFLRTLEEAVGRERFSLFLQRYVETFRFRSITTDDFVALIEKELPGTLARVDAGAWIDGEGVPRNAPAPRSARLAAVEKVKGTLPEEETVREWTPTEWQLFLEGIVQPAPPKTLEALDARFHLTQSQNYEVLVRWLAIAARSDYRPAFARIEEVLGKVGRMKYLKPLYHALANVPASRPLARRCFDTLRGGYHPIAQQVVEGLLKQNGA